LGKNNAETLTQLSNNAICAAGACLVISLALMAYMEKMLKKHEKGQKTIYLKCIQHV